LSLQTWWLFAVAVFVLCGTPGPNMLHVMSRSVHCGFRRSMATMAGCLLAVVLVLLGASTGLGALLLASSTFFDVLRYVGVAYLLWLGIQAWRHAGKESTAASGSYALNTLQLFRGGFWIGVSNPKFLLFVAAFLPQFIDPARPQLMQWLILGATFALCELFWYTVYGIGGHALGRCLQRPRLRLWFDRATGLIFIGFGALLLRFKPQ
jgi:homoserine/homoserine lactone efflux protein